MKNISRLPEGDAAVVEIVMEIKRDRMPMMVVLLSFLFFNIGVSSSKSKKNHKESKKTKTLNKRTCMRNINWFFGILFLLMSFLLIIAGASSQSDTEFNFDIISAIGMLLIALFILPPIRDFMFLRTGGIKIPWHIKCLIIFLIFITTVNFSESPEKKG